MHMKGEKNQTLMLLTGGLFKRFKCFWTSSFCLDWEPNLAAQAIEITEHHNQTTINNPPLFAIFACVELPHTQNTHFFLV